MLLLFHFFGAKKEGKGEKEIKKKTREMSPKAIVLNTIQHDDIHGHVAHDDLKGMDAKRLNVCTNCVGLYI